MRQQIRSLAAAIGFFTRIPLPSSLKLGPEDERHCQTFFPLLGWMIGLSQAGVYYAAVQLLPPIVAAILAIAWAVLLTGGLHEDGLADCADGFGGGYHKDQILRIMRDSRLGTFGTIALLLSFAVKVSVLSQLTVAHVIIAFFIAAPLSRLAAITLTWTMPYAYTSATSLKSNLTSNMTDTTTSWRRRSLQILCGLAPLLILHPGLAALLLLGLFGLVYLANIYLKLKLQGYTGDCLGALQQLSELVILLSLSLWSRWHVLS